jgi:hypothetical protein
MLVKKYMHYIDYNTFLLLHNSKQSLRSKILKVSDFQTIVNSYLILF